MTAAERLPAAVDAVRAPHARDLFLGECPLCGCRLPVRLLSRDGTLVTLRCDRAAGPCKTPVVRHALRGVLR